MDSFIKRSNDERPYALDRSSHYAQSPEHIARLAMTSDRYVLAVEGIVLMEEYGEHIAKQVYVLQKASGMN